MELKEELDANLLEKSVLQPFNYYRRKDFEKRYTVKLMKAFNTWMNIPSDKYSEIGNVIQDLLTMHLLIDDVVDNSTLRGGVPVPHHVFSLANTVNSANYMYINSLKRISELAHSDGVRLFIESSLDIHFGQGLDIYYRERLLCPTEEEYKQMVDFKTNRMFRLIIQLMQLFSDDKRDFTKIVTLVALHYQITNDYANLKCDEYTSYKGFCEDLTEGNFSFPIIHSIRSNPGDLRLMNIIRQKTTDITLKKYALDIMEETGSFEYTRKILSDLESEIREEMVRLGHNEDIIALVDELKMH